MANVTPVGTAATSQQQGSTKLPVSAAQQKKNEFLQLLVAQLKGQNPLDPLDGTQFVTQLAQFSGLEELVGIHASLQKIETFLQQSAATNK
jgi:flagellar basal-body rod modification protein FlgD